MKARTETELIADCHRGTEVDLVTPLGFYSMFGSLESLLNLEQKHEMVTAISPSPNADSILRATQDVQRELNADCNLRDLNIIYNVMITASRSNGEDKVELPGWGPEDWVKPGSCLAEVCGLNGHVCGGLDCVKTLERQHKQLTILFGNIVMKTKTEMKLIADCHGGTEVNLVTALGLYSMFGSLESPLNLEQKHEMVTIISVAVFPGVFQTEQKYIGMWREAIEA